MNSFRTTFSIEPLDSRISYADSILSIGSCFAENIGQRMIDLKYPLLMNPFGILYNPMSILNALNRIQAAEEFTEEELVKGEGLYHSWFHHGKFSDTNASRALNKINAEIICAKAALDTLDYLIITWGTASVFTLKGTDQVVANCHKFPATDFHRKFLSVEEIVSAYKVLIDHLLIARPALKIILTVSPVRHWKDGAAQNQRSKARLLLAAENLEEAYSNVHYFPSYELLMDDLRDYRFYKNDMLHPSEEAIDYIWKNFSDYGLHSEEETLRKKVYKIYQGLHHRPLYDRRPEHKTFLEKLLSQITEIESQSSSIDYTKEKEKINERLDHF